MVPLHEPGVEKIQIDDISAEVKVDVWPPRHLTGKLHGIMEMDLGDLGLGNRGWFSFHYIRRLLNP